MLARDYRNVNANATIAISKSAAEESNSSEPKSTRLVDSLNENDLKVECGTDQEHQDNVILHGIYITGWLSGSQEKKLIEVTEFKEYLAIRQNGPSRKKYPTSQASSEIPALEQQIKFLSLSNEDSSFADHQSACDIEDKVLVSSMVDKLEHEMPSQFSLLGHLVSEPSARIRDPRIMLNTNVPFSAFICGLQGSGKSHTTSCIIGMLTDFARLKIPLTILLENCSLSFPPLGILKRPLSTLVLHFNEYSSHINSQPCEAAFLSSTLPEYCSQQAAIPVKILVSPSNFTNLQRMYSQIPNVQVCPFQLQPRHLSIGIMLSLMSLNKSDSMPLYMAQLLKVLREMAMETGGAFHYFDFRKRLKNLKLNRAQTPFLDQRLDLLDSFLDIQGKNTGDYFIDGGVTILDLSCPFVDQSTACILFRIAIDLFLHANLSRGKLVVADEAHKVSIFSYSHYL
jgi:hypothetical protein